MRLLKTISIVLVACAIALTLACSDRPPKAPDIAGDIRHSLDQAGLNDVSVSQDRDKSVVTLTGKVATDDDKARAESIARSIAGTEVVSNEIGVRPGGDESTAKKVDSDLDSGIDKNLEAMLIQHRLKRDVKYDVTSGDWTWMAGSNTTGTLGVYPATVGTGGSSTYFPGARSYSTTWADATGNVWLFGGTDGTNFFNDLWKFDGTYWTWEAGSNSTGVAGSYPATTGTGGSLTYFPGARKGAASWIDSGGNLWLFGGDSNNNYFNDLWKFDGMYWTWVGGSSATNTKGTYGTKTTGAPGNIPGARLLGTFGVDASGAFWLFGGFGVDSAGNRGYLNDLWKYGGGTWTWMSGAEVGDTPTASAVYGVFPAMKGATGPTYVPGGRESACAWVDATGNFWVYGGWGYDGAGAQNYLGDLWMFDGTSWTWESGSNSANLPGVYGLRGTAALSNVPGTRWNPMGWYAGGKLWMFSGSGNDTATTPGVLNDLWSYLP